MAPTAPRDSNYVTTLLAASNVDGVTPVVLWADPTTHRLLVMNTVGSTFADGEIPTGTINGVNAVFTLAHTPAAASNPLVVVQGQVQNFSAPGAIDYTIAVATITFNAGSIPPNTSWLKVWYRY